MKEEIQRIKEGKERNMSLNTTCTIAISVEAEIRYRPINGERGTDLYILGPVTLRVVFTWNKYDCCSCSLVRYS